MGEYGRISTIDHPLQKPKNDTKVFRPDFDRDSWAIRLTNSYPKRRWRAKERNTTELKIMRAPNYRPNFDHFSIETTMVTWGYPILRSPFSVDSSINLWGLQPGGWLNPHELASS